MKRAGLINLICSLIVVISLTIAGIATVVIGKAIAEESDGAPSLFERGNLVLSSASATTIYSGKKLTNSAWELLEGQLKSGHKLYVTVSGSQTGVGISENHIVATVKDDDGVDVTDQYNIEYRPGALNVRARTITINAESDMKVYDGTPLVADGYKLESKSSLLSGDILRVSVEGSITEKGSADSTVTDVQIYDQFGNDVTHNYNIKTGKGNLVVYTPDDLVIKTLESQKSYDGTPLTSNEWEHESGELLDGHRIVVEAYGSQTDVGTSPNEFEAYVVDEYGNDVSDNYSIVKVPGDLTVSKREVEIQSESDQKRYDGTPLTNPGFSVLPLEVMYNPYIIFDVKVTGTVTEPSKVENTIDSYKITDSSGRDITDFFDVKLTPGELEILPEDLDLINITYLGGSAEKIYDGKPLTSEKWEILEGELLPGHVSDVVCLGSITDAGKANNDIKVVIRNEQGYDVSGFYNITTTPGILKVDPIAIEIKSNTAEKVYDGTPLTDTGYTVIPEAFLESYRLEVNVTGTITDPGERPNTIRSCTVTALDGSPINQDNFEIVRVEGILSIVASEEDLKPILVYKTDSSRKTYDGKPLTNSGYRRTSGELLDGHFEKVEMNASITDVGTVSNTITVRIVDGEDNDVSDQYIIKCEGKNVGTLEVLPKSVTIVANSDSQVYDGTPLTNDGYTLGDDFLFSEDYTVNVSIEGSQTNAGVSANKITSYEIYDADGNPITKNYDITTVNGKLEVTKRKIKISPVDATKAYDGTPLTCTEYELSPADNAVLSAHELYVEISGSQTEPGSSYSKISNVEITDKNTGYSVMDNYKIDFSSKGTLKVTEAASGGAGGSANDGGIGIGGGSKSNKVVFKVKTNSSETLYLKMASYGNYTTRAESDKCSWTKAPEYTGTLLPNGESPYFVTSYIIANNTGNTAKKKCYYIKPQTSIDVLPYFVNNTAQDVYGSSFVGSSTDSIVKGTSDYVQSEFSYYTWSGQTNYTMPSYCKEAELLYRNFVSENYLYVDDDTLAYLEEIINLNGDLFDTSKHDVTKIIKNVSTYIKKSAKYNLDYNTALDNEYNIVVSFLRDYKVGICQHYASAATLLFRALGIPARYTTGFAVSTKANTEVSVSAKMAHAWVEVYINGIGWVNVEVTGTGSPALGQDSFELTVKPVHTEEIVDTTELFAQQSVTVTGFEALREAGYTYKLYDDDIIVSGSNAGLGKTESAVERFRIYDEFGNLVYDKESGLGEDIFSVTYETGTIHRYLSVLRYSSAGVNRTKTYDGVAIEFTEDDCILVDGVIYSGYDVIVTPTVQVNAADIPARFTVKFTQNGEDVTDHYKISYEYGRLTVYKKNIDLTAADATKPWDQKPLTKNELVDDYADKLAPGDWIDLDALVIEGSQTNIGYSSNVIRKVVIRNANGTDVTANYNITIHDGLLTVTRPVK